MTVALSSSGMELMGLAEIAEMLNVGRSRADQLARQKGFPEPIAELAAGRIYDRKAVEKWARENGRIK